MILLTGASGKLGAVIMRDLSPRLKISAFSKSGGEGIHPLDLSDPAAFPRMLDLEPEAVINAAGVSSPTLCTGSPAEAWSVNVTMPLELARYCETAGIPFVHFSSDLVYSGGCPPYGAGSPSVPLSYYGWTKLIADRAILSTFPDSLILRTSVLCGETPSKRSTFSQDLLGGRIKGVYVDSFRNHTPLSWLVLKMEEMLKAGTRGLLVAAGAVTLSRAAYAEELLRRHGRDPEELTLTYSPRGIPANLALIPDLAAGDAYS